MKDKAAPEADAKVTEGEAIEFLMPARGMSERVRAEAAKSMPSSEWSDWIRRVIQLAGPHLWGALHLTNYRDQ